MSFPKNSASQLLPKLFFSCIKSLFIIQHQPRIMLIVIVGSIDFIYLFISKQTINFIMEK